MTPHVRLGFVVDSNGEAEEVHVHTIEGRILAARREAYAVGQALADFLSDIGKRLV
ncbi:hypothetical protein SEA_CEN1621_75 [Microbacterium phage Cen1621]|uniref:Uncharacterized protein n=1 Tax=Microbacterium phage Cen1621 TaxID=2965191 RepID=A0A9E7QBM4_9CAUD|nr:hypothetical protein SEA_CEN1621_75 [Microbacterium phage Cen1621]